jgi:hypothetical protein
MKMLASRPYEIQLASLVKLVQSDTPQGNQVTDVLKSGNEDDIRQMLMNFGNPGTEWAPVTTALPWTPWQIDQAVADLNMIQPSGVTTSARFWAW